MTICERRRYIDSRISLICQQLFLSSLCFSNHSFLIFNFRFDNDHELFGTILCDFLSILASVARVYPIEVCLSDVLLIN
jgi:hypothetical protein